MAWTSSNWISQSTDALKLSTLEAHIAEVSAQIETRADAVSSDGSAMTRVQLMDYLDRLFQERDRLESKTTRGVAGGRSHIRFVRPS